MQRRKRCLFGRKFIDMTRGNLEKTILTIYVKAHVYNDGTNGFKSRFSTHVKSFTYRNDSTFFGLHSYHVTYHNIIIPRNHLNYSFECIILFND